MLGSLTTILEEDSSGSTRLERCSEMTKNIGNVWNRNWSLSFARFKERPGPRRGKLRGYFTPCWESMQEGCTIQHSLSLKYNSPLFSAVGLSSRYMILSAGNPVYRLSCGFETTNYLVHHICNLRTVSNVSKSVLFVIVREKFRLLKWV